ncbi:MAG: hypothetical protein M3P51_08880 [Chloroflexota bacterium]|nr:hypothetical protein [Chloroflexota bacterium]
MKSELPGGQSMGRAGAGAERAVAAVRRYWEKIVSDAGIADDPVSRELLIAVLSKDSFVPLEVLERRERFLYLVGELAPEVLDSLRAEVLPTYQGALNPHAYEWARSHFLHVRWALKAVETTLNAMRVDPEARFFIKEVLVLGSSAPHPANVRTILLPYGQSLRPTPGPEEISPPLAFEIPGWDRRESRKKARSRMITASRRAIDAYFEQVDAAALQAGHHRPSTNYGDTDKHLRWLIRWNLQGWTKPMILREQYGTKGGVTRGMQDTITKGVKKASKQLGLPVRRGAGGRPSTG